MAVAWANRIGPAKWIVGGHLVSLVAGLASIRLFTELAPPAVFGSANLLIGALTLGMNVLLAPITQTQIRYHSTHNDAGDGAIYTHTVARIALAAAALVAFIAALAILLVPREWIGADRVVAVLVIGWIAVATWRAVLINRVQAERQQRRFAAWLASEAVLLVAATAIMLFVSPTVEGYVLGQLGGMALAVLAFGRAPSATGSHDARARAEVARDARAQIMRYGLPFALFSLLAWLSNLADRYVAAVLLDPTAVGQYVAAFGIASRLPGLLGGLLADLFRPAMFEALGRGEHPRARRLFGTWLVAQCCGVSVLLLGLLLAGELLARILLAAEYRAGALPIMLWVAAGYGCHSLMQVVENRILGTGESRALVSTKLVGAVANVGFALLLIPAWGILGAASANAAGHALLLAVTIACWLGLRRARYATA